MGGLWKNELKNGFVKSDCHISFPLLTKMKARFKVEKEDPAMDAPLLKLEMDTPDTTTHLKQEPHFRNHAIAIDAPKQELKPDIIQVKIEASYQDVKMADDSDSDMSESTIPDAVKQEVMEMSPSLELDIKSHQTGIGDASLLHNVAKQPTISPKPIAKSTNALACPGTSKAFEKSGRDYFYQCHLCSALKTTLLDLLNHLKRAHRFTYRSRTYKHLKLEPDLQDPNFYCRVCETTYPSYYLFNKHLRIVHYIITKTTRSPPTITSLQAIKKEKEHPEPEYNDPNNYCRTCKRSYGNKHRYHAHLVNFHGLPRFGRKKDVLPDIFDPNYYCRSCERSLSTRAIFQQHCLRWHNITVPNKKDLPNIHDPTFRCKPCDNTFENKDTFWQHCREVHLITDFKEEGPKPVCDSCNRSYANESRYKRHRRLVHGETFSFTITRKPKLVNDLPPDMNDPNFYCRACDKKLSCKAGFRTHLAVYHNMFLPVKKLKSPSEATTQPDQTNYKYYCLSCDNRYPTTTKYREHLELIHHVQGAASETKAHIPLYLPDPDDPNFYCRTCGKTKPTLLIYRTHLRNIHHMRLPKLKRTKKQHSSDGENSAAAIPPPPKRTFFVCPVCGKRMKSERKFAYHSKTHERLTKRQDVGNPDVPQVDTGSSGVENSTHTPEATAVNDTDDQPDAVDDDLSKTLDDIDQAMGALGEL
ncbi:hypothetical protein MAM1_0038d02764 [Mucor ambiguus]|uniref:C2H2-type domain-containing protein n=1 Tax=Mucor ambiguus TaxID=91626 RepID=A0A0C9M362_9FUNG|nr:hypothetical protein MAM1_0038d02764 [Mucor ambiguus]